MENYTREEIDEALRPIASLISKSEKAQQKLAPGSWQHTMLQGNLKALRMASALMSKNGVENYTREDLQEALLALNKMISKSEKAQGMFPPGTPQHTLQRNRLKALRIASEWIGSVV
jgi:hypothetical protein